MSRTSSSFNPDFIAAHVDSEVVKGFIVAADISVQSVLPGQNPNFHHDVRTVSDSMRKLDANYTKVARKRTRSTDSCSEGLRM